MILSFIFVSMKGILPQLLFLVLLGLCIIAKSQTQVTFYTSMGTFVAQLEEKKAPITVANFIKLVNEKFYDSIIFHRVVKGFVIQGGDPTGTGNGGCGYTIADEFDSMSNVIRTLGMANEGTPHSGGSQFYINLVNNIFLDHKYSVFGKVITNFTVVQNIGKVAVNGADRPLTDVVMDSVRITLANGIGNASTVISEASITPNPVNEKSVLSFTSLKPGSGTLKVYNELGVNVAQINCEMHEGFNAISVATLSELPAGIYYWLLDGNENFQRNKLVVTK